MTEWHGWTLSRKETKEWLAECQKRRLKEGRTWKAAARARVEQLESSGREWEAEQASRTLHRRSVIFARRARQRHEAALERDLRRVGASVRRNERERDQVKDFGAAPLFEFEPKRAGSRVREGRDLYWEWISRGFGKRATRNYSKSKSPRIRAREAKWSDGEFQEKIAYIERADALEEIEGNLLSNMGAEQAERIGCAERIEALERVSRKDASVYVHSILALPAELSPEGRAKLLNDLCSNLARMRLPFAAALHKPDPKNDQRNFHAHILVSLRPFERLDDKWEFAATKSTWLSTPAGLKLQRRIIARAFNKALEAERATARWTHRSRAADGLAPGGFTKKGGVSGKPPKLPEDVEEVVLASGWWIAVRIKTRSNTFGWPSLIRFR
ncbi:MobA/MobL family protein [Erythrobacter sp. SD-21]|uniref:MobA/MobL family protein n=1 Tax=Erythrobacter sp. SD-21 TaxID=161528 RepID=UPI000A04E913|nr:MobA/MobL family protein [Erythrobacter sp. SD-21]